MTLSAGDVQKVVELTVACLSTLGESADRSVIKDVVDHLAKSLSQRHKVARPILLAVLSSLISYIGPRPFRVNIDGFEIAGSQGPHDTLLCDLSSENFTLFFQNCDIEGDLDFTNSRLERIEFADVRINRIILSRVRAAAVKALRIAPCEGYDTLEVVGTEAIIDGGFYISLATSSRTEVKLTDARIGLDVDIRVDEMKNDAHASRRIALEAVRLQVGRRLILSGRKNDTALISASIPEARIEHDLFFKYAEVVEPGFDFRLANVERLCFSDTNIEEWLRDRPPNENLRSFTYDRVLNDSRDRLKFWKSFSKISDHIKVSGHLLTLGEALNKSGYKRESKEILILEKQAELERSSNSTAGIAWNTRLAVMVAWASVSFSFFVLIIIPFIESSIVRAILAVLVGVMLAILIKLKSTRNWLSELLDRLFRTVSYRVFGDGLKPSASLPWLFFLWAFGAAFFAIGSNFGYMTPTSPGVYHVEHLLHSIDHFTQIDKWKRSQGPSGDEGSEGGSANKAKPDPIRPNVVLRKSDAYYRSCMFRDGSGGELDTGRMKQRIHQFRQVPLVTVYEACRLNWAVSTDRVKESWGDRIDKEMTRLLGQSPDSFNFANEMTPNASNPLSWKEVALSMDRDCICQAFLPAEHSQFNPLIYSLDIAIPLLDLRQEREWSPRTIDPKTGNPDLWGGFLLFWETLQIAFGWFLALIFAGLIAGLSDPTTRRRF